jgi:hypothetical protein
LKNKKKDIENKIKELTLQLDTMNKQEEESKKLRTLESYTTQEKIQVFDSFYADAKNKLDQKIAGTYPEDDDDEHWCFEAIMNLLGKEIWNIWNKA